MREMMLNYINCLFCRITVSGSGPTWTARSILPPLSWLQYDVLLPVVSFALPDPLRGSNHIPTRWQLMVPFFMLLPPYLFLFCLSVTDSAEYNATIHFKFLAIKQILSFLEGHWKYKNEQSKSRKLNFSAPRLSSINGTCRLCYFKSTFGFLHMV